MTVDQIGLSVSCQAKKSSFGRPDPFYRFTYIGLQVYKAGSVAMRTAFGSPGSVSPIPRSQCSRELSVDSDQLEPASRNPGKGL